MNLRSTLASSAIVASSYEVIAHQVRQEADRLIEKAELHKTALACVPELFTQIGRIGVTAHLFSDLGLRARPPEEGVSAKPLLRFVAVLLTMIVRDSLTDRRLVWNFDQPAWATRLSKEYSIETVTGNQLKGATDKPIALMLGQSYMERTESPISPRVRALQAEALSQSHTVLATSISNTDDFCKTISDVAERHGKIDTLWIHAHGSPRAIAFHDNHAEGFLDLYRIYQTGCLNGLSRYATIVLDSCETGAPVKKPELNVAEVLALSAPKSTRVLAPRRLIYGHCTRIKGTNPLRVFMSNSTDCQESAQVTTFTKHGMGTNTLRIKTPKT